MKKITSIVVFIFFSASFLNAQQFIKTSVRYIYEYEFVVYFKDKPDSTFSIDRPEEFLSQKAIDRRTKYNIPVTRQDLPVSEIYLQELRDMGLKVTKWSKWLNCAIITTEDTSLIADVRSLDFVIPKPQPQPKNYQYEELDVVRINDINDTTTDIYDYGVATNQVTMLNVNKLHNMGYSGEGVLMAILDAGFFRVNKLSMFDSLWANNQIKGYYDFVDMDTTVFNVGDHGLMVLSTIGGNQEGYVGTAPKANFWLFRTEDGDSETQLEEYNFVIACEMADSVGVDIIHASLGYSDFDVEETSYIYEQLDGNTAVSTVGADIAASKGIIVTSSAGNEGNDPWTYISAPSDGDSVLAVGSVTYRGGYSSFSSLGPSYDGRVKPDVSAQGSSAYVQGRKNVQTASGTSFSGPIMAGAVACLFQAFPDNNNMEIFDAVRISSNQIKSPNDKLGYGIPDFLKAYSYLQKMQD